MLDYLILTDQQEVELRLTLYSSEGNPTDPDPRAHIQWTSSDLSILVTTPSKEDATHCMVSTTGKPGVATINGSYTLDDNKKTISAVIQVVPSSGVMMEISAGIPQDRADLR